MIIMYTLTVHRLSKKFQNLKSPLKKDSISCLDKLKNCLISACGLKDERLNCLNYLLKRNKTQRDEKYIYVENKEFLESNKNAESLTSSKIGVSFKAKQDTISEPIKSLKLLNSITLNTDDSMANENPNLMIKKQISVDDNKALKQFVQRHRLVNRTIAVFQKTAVKNEQKAVKVLGIVFIVFVIAWVSFLVEYVKITILISIYIKVPFAIVNMLSALCPNCDQYPPILDFLVWLGYISSCINPLIYTIFSKNFRKAFKLILCCKIRRSSLKKYSFKRINEFKFSRNRNDSSINMNKQQRSIKLSIISFSQSKFTTESSTDEFTRMGYLRFIKPQTDDTILESETNVLT
jgi:hypothetical protein